MEREDRQFVDAFARGLAILEALSREQRPLNNGELSRATGLPPSTVSRLTHTAMALGYLRFSQSKRAYELTPKNLTLGYPVLAGMTLLDRARPLLKQLSEETGETVGLVIRDGLHVTFVEVVQGSEMVAVRLATGGRLPIAVSAAGIAILAAMPDRDRRILATRVRADLAKRGGNVDAFNAKLVEATELGICVIRDAWRRGIGGIAMGLENNGEMAAITMPIATGSVSEMDMHGRLADALRATIDLLRGAPGGAHAVQTGMPSEARRRSH
ncbi:Transcriptional regulator, IclR family protein [Hyphomicrobiales bacterium]|nr:Transcriptional regulator, IclR family protein [Hyphomicrobiales bacterium]CAH1695319.1 Transcriptional regulator, IclR family protein [Hyphomicrobiales bacterium]